MISVDKAILCLLSHERDVPVERMLSLLRSFKGSEASVRTSLSRLKKEGLVVSRRDHKAARYSLTEQGEAALVLTDVRTLRRARYWDGRWHLITFDIPERLRYSRDALRKHLLFLGYGILQSSVMISPYDKRAAVQELIADYGIEEHVEFFSANYEGGGSHEELVSRIWDLKRLEREYRSFIAIYRDELGTFKDRVAHGEIIDPSYAFLKRVEVNDTFARIISVDPQLPPELLAADWIGFTAERVCVEYLNFLATRAPEK
ncbi:MAG: PaaX family transcriptional regulator C-terminal domain-containing protein [Candidatus Methanospirareceae archaeon]